MNEYNNMLIRHFSPEASGGIKMASNPGFVSTPSGVPHIDLSFGDNEQSINVNASIIENMVKGFSGKTMFSAENHDPTSLSRLFANANPGSDNYVVNGVYVPDLVERSELPVRVEVINRNVKVSKLSKEVVYYVIDDENAPDIVLHLKEMGYYAAYNVGDLMDEVNLASANLNIQQ